MSSPKSVKAPGRRPRGRPPSPESRDRILGAALRLFAEQGYSATSVGEVQSAAGLSAGSGALYKHFSSKEELLAEGVERELVHLEGVRRARQLIPDLADFRTELEILGRFILLELGAERDLLRILLKDGDRFPKLMADARRRLIEPAYEEFAAWMRSHVEAGRACADDIDALAAVALGAIVQYRAIEALLGAPPGGQDEEAFLQAWVKLVSEGVRG